MKSLLRNVLLGTLLTTNIYAACDATGCNEVTIDRLYALDTNDILIETSGIEANLNCTSFGGASSVITLEDSNPSKNIFFSLLLTAQTTNQKVYIAITPNSTNCSMAYMYTIK
ncbi:MAG: hypothetical protein Q9M36_10745 [Sulfurovum sp.]|nr:hypothetical protein [Sulfurovum sp.]